MTTRPRLALHVLLAAGALALSACSGDGGGGGGIDQRSETSVANGYVRAIASEEYEKACSVEARRDGSVFTPIADDDAKMQNCIKNAERTHRYLDEAGALDLARAADGKFLESDVYRYGDPTVVYPGLALDSTDGSAHIGVVKIDGKFYVDDPVF